MIIESAFRFDWNFMCNDSQFFEMEVIRFGLDGFLGLFIPIATAFVSIPLICDEYKTGFMRFEVFRTTKRILYSARFISSCVSAGVAVALGFGIFVLFVIVMFPGINDMQANINEMIMEQYGGPEMLSGAMEIAVILKYLLGVFFYGFFSVVPALFISGFCRNKYLVISLPFFLKYIIDQWCDKIRLGTLTGEYSSDGFMCKAAQMVDPDSVVWYWDMNDRIGIVLYRTLLFLVVFSGYIIIQNRRIDCGE